MVAASLYRLRSYKLDQSGFSEFKKIFLRLDGFKIKNENTFYPLSIFKNFKATLCLFLKYKIVWYELSFEIMLDDLLLA